MNYMTVTQAAARWNISAQRVRALLKEDRIVGAERPGHDWLIPIDAKKPEDGRRKM